MDYGRQDIQYSQSGQNDPNYFFTAGVGNASPDVNASGPSLNSTAIDTLTGQAQEYSTQGLPRDAASTTYGEAGAIPDSRRFATTGANLATEPRNDGRAGARRESGIAPEPRHPGQMYSEPATAALGVIRPTDPTPVAPTPATTFATTARIHPQGDHISEDTVQAMGTIEANFHSHSHSLADAYAEALAARDAYRGDADTGGHQ